MHATKPSEPSAGDKALQEVAVRCKSPEDAALVLKAVRVLRRYRARCQQHKPFKGHTSRMVLQVLRGCHEAVYLSSLESGIAQYPI